MRRPTPAITTSAGQQPRRQNGAAAVGGRVGAPRGAVRRKGGRPLVNPYIVVALVLSMTAVLVLGLSYLHVVKLHPSIADGDATGNTGDEDRDGSVRRGGRATPDAKGRGRDVDMTHPDRRDVGTTVEVGDTGSIGMKHGAGDGGGGGTRNPPKLMKEPNNKPRATIGYAVSLTSCPDPNDSESLTDGGAVLRHSIHLNSIRSNDRREGRGDDESLGGGTTSNYDYATYAIVHPSAKSCSSQLADVGYTILIRETPIDVSEIRGEYLRERITKNGCCGEKELIKLHAYTLVEHPIVVHLDLDTLILRPMDELFDAMLGHAPSEPIPVAFGRDLPDQIDAYFTRDYNMKTVTPTKPGLVQGGFLVLRPSVETFDSMKEVIREGNFKPGSGGGSGWGGRGYNGYGSMTFQGLIPYFYDVVAAPKKQPGADEAPHTTTAHTTATAVELNRCIYNTMADNPRDQKTVNDVVHGKCRDGREECEDCRNLDFFPHIKTAHFTLCQKPWHCLPQDQDMIQKRLCRRLHHRWFTVRKDLEDSWGVVDGGTAGTFQPDHFMGYCTRMGKMGYVPMLVPPDVAEGRAVGATTE